MFLYGPWTGGRVVGALARDKWAFYLRMGPPHKSITFRHADYGGEGPAHEAANAAMRLLSDKYQLTKNMHRTALDPASGNSWIEFQLTQGKVLEIDEADFEYVRTLHMGADFDRGVWYCRVSFGRRNKIYLHNLLLGVVGIDHIDRRGLNNRRGNLRVADGFVQANNRRMLSTNTSGRTGVTKARNSWVAKGRGETLGRFSARKLGDAEAKRRACAARQAWEDVKQVTSARTKNDDRRYEPAFESAPPLVKPYLCPLCDMRGRSKQAITRHVAARHADA